MYEIQLEQGTTLAGTDTERLFNEHGGENPPLVFDGDQDVDGAVDAIQSEQETTLAGTDSDNLFQCD